jgi:two-component system chemotaxis response regulator CheY
MKILVVDDSGVVRRVILRELSALGITEVIQAANGEEAIRAYALHNPDAVTLDITMPEMDGIQCVDELIKLNPHARIMIISALADETTAIDAVERGANGYLCKPFSTEEIREALAELMAD